MKRIFVLVLIGCLLFSSCERKPDNIRSDEIQYTSNSTIESNTTVSLIAEEETLSSKSALVTEYTTSDIEVAIEQTAEIDQSDDYIIQPTEQTEETAISTDKTISEISESFDEPIENKQDHTYETKNLLSEFAVEPRRLNEDGAKRAVDFIAEKLSVCGWNVSEKEFPVYQYKDIISEPYGLRSDDSECRGKGVNIVAESPNFDAEKRTIILSAHYDTTKDNIGIIDNGSGTAFLLSAAALLSDVELSFNIRFVFFDMEEYSMYGSKYYLENMTDEERNSIIANINFDMIGGSSDSLTISTSNGIESALSIYLNELLNNKYNLSAKGMYSDSNAFMHWQIPAVTFIDESLPLEPIENKEHIDLLSDNSFNDILSDIVLIINSFDKKEFEELKNGSIETEHSDVQNFSSLTGIYNKMTSLNVSDFEMNRCYSKLYDNGISSCLCCEYLSSDGRVFTIETLSEITTDTKVNVLSGIPSFEDCKAAASGDAILIDPMINYKVKGELSDEELKTIWSFLR